MRTHESWQLNSYTAFSDVNECRRERTRAVRTNKSESFVNLNVMYAPSYGPKIFPCTQDFPHRHILNGNGCKEEIQLY